MKKIIYLSFFLITNLLIFANNYVVYNYNGHSIKYSSNLVYLTLYQNHNYDEIINNLSNKYNFQIVERLKEYKNSFFFTTNTFSISNKKLDEIIKAEEPLLRTFLVKINDNFTPRQFIEIIKKERNLIQFAEMVEFPELLYKPNDSKINQQTTLNLINIFDLWDVEKGNPDIIIGISDSGTDQNHEDLKDNIAINKYEIPDDGVDNDGNGYIDDYAGYNFAAQYDGVSAGNTYNASITHGQQVAGIAGATTDNNLGIAGTGFRSKIFPIKIIEGSSLKYAYKSIIYAADRGFKVLNLSWGSPKMPSDIDQLIINYAISRDVAIVAAGGNIGSGGANEVSSFYPANYKGVLGVGEVNSEGKFTNSTVLGIGTRLLAPGEGNLTLNNNNGYRVCEGGSSFSAPLVAGVLALVRSRYPELNAIQSIEYIRQCSDLQYEPQNHHYYKLAPGLLNLRKVRDIHPLSIPGIVPEKFIYKNQNEIVTDRFFKGDFIKANIVIKNVLGKAQNLKFVLMEAYDPANAVSIMDSVVNIDKIESNETIEIKDFKIAILQNYSQEIILRVDIYGENGYRDFFKFGFIPYKQISTFNNEEFFLSIADNGELGYYTENDVVGVGMGLFSTGNQLYKNSTIMISEGESVQSKKVVYNDYNNYQYDFKTIKGFIPPDQNVGIVNDDFANTSKIGVEITQKVEFISNNSKSARIKVAIKNISNKNLSNLAIGYFTDWDITPETDKNKAKYLENAIPENYLDKSAVEIAYMDLNDIVFGSGVITNENFVTPIAASLSYAETQNFDALERIKVLNNGIDIQTDETTDLSTVVGLRFEKDIPPGETRYCNFCFAGGKNLTEFIYEMKNCLSNSTNIDKNTENYILIYPNPAFDIINIDIASKSYKIYNAIGELVYNIEFPYLNNNLITVDISKFPSGIYFIKVDHSIEKFIKY